MRWRAHETTTAQLKALFPVVASTRCSVEHVWIGRDLTGGTFSHDPFECYDRGDVTNPNMAILGGIGRGKSALVKTFLLREAAVGRSLVVLDPKGEYDALATALGCRPLPLRAGGEVRLNPLDLSVGGRREETSRVRLELLVSFAEAVLGRRLQSGEHLASALALESAEAAGRPDLRRVMEALLQPAATAGAPVHASREELRRDGRAVAYELRRYLQGDLRGIFDGSSSSALELDGQALVVDLSALHGSPALPAVLATVQAIVQRRLARHPRPTLLVLDEAWGVLADEHTSRLLQSSFKLARTTGTAHVLVTHRVSDLGSSGAAGSVTAQVSLGLLADCETLVTFAQHPQEAAGMAAVGLNERERELLPTLPRGVAIWHVGRARRLVEHRVAPDERAVVDTDAAMRAGTGLPGLVRGVTGAK